MTIWIGHRGYRHKHSENTFGAFDAAVKHGFQMIETDLRTTADGHIILYHDRNLRKIGGAGNACIEQMTRQEAKSMRYACGCEPVFLDEFIKRYRNCGWLFDIKSESGRRTLNLLHEKFDLPNIASNSFFLFDKRAHERVLRSLLPDARIFARKFECVICGLALLFRLPMPGRYLAGKTFGVPPRLAGVSLYNAKLIDRFHRRGAKVIAYLPANTADAEKALSVGVDMVLTDYGIV